MVGIDLFLHYNYKIYCYDCKKDDLLSSVVEKFKKSLGISDSKFNLAYNAKNLDQNKTLSELDLLDNFNYKIFVREIGAVKGGVSMKFADLSKNIYEELYFKDTAPDYRIVSKGINVFGICLSKKCNAYKKEVIFPLKK